MCNVNHTPVACEKAKMQINQRIESDEIIAMGSFEEFTESDEYYLSSYEFDEEIFNSNAPKLSEWLDSIDKDAKQFVASSDDGDRDNILENVPFANHFLRLCKLLPLWCGISCKFFNTPNRTGSSWQSETWYKNLKQMHGQHIPCSVDGFVERDLRLTNASVILASRQYSVTSRKKTKMIDIHESDESNDDKPDENLNTDDQNLDQANSTTIDHVKCAACKRGDNPTGLHTCVSCSKPIHLFDDCSVDIGDEEGCGQKRMCMSCHTNGTPNTEQQIATSIASKDSKSLTIQEMNYVDIWQKKNQRTGIKHSKYMKSVQNWSLVDIEKKVKIGHLINGNLSKTAHKVDGKLVNLQNTCALDCVIQLLAASYAYNKTYKSFVDVNAKDDIFEIAKLLAIK